MPVLPSPIQAKFSWHKFEETKFLKLLDCKTNGSRVADYLYRYLCQEQVQTIVMEERYHDHDNNLHTCRLHFFQHDKETVERSFKNSVIHFSPDSEFTLRDCGYCGYVVVRSVGEMTRIGRSILARKGKAGLAPGTASRDCCVVPCVANISGTDIELLSLPFQEQCSIDTSCGTIALWTAFQVVQNHYGTPRAPSPKEIMEDVKKLRATAGEQALSASETVELMLQGHEEPEHHLSYAQMVQLIRHYGYGQHGVQFCTEPRGEDEAIRRMLPMRSLLYGYLKFQFPVILNVRLGTPAPEDPVSPADSNDNHSLLLTGFETSLDVRSNHVNWPEEDSLPLEDPSEIQFKLKGRRIKGLYAHDDQIGPFCEMRVQANSWNKLPFVHPVVLTGTWHDENGVATGSWLPLYPISAIPVVRTNIHLHYAKMLYWLYPFHAAFRDFFAVPPIRLRSPEVSPAWECVEWDIYLISAKDYKLELRKDPHLDPSLREQFVLSVYPMFMWRALLRSDRREVAELLFDATQEDQQCNPLVRIRWMNTRFGNMMKGPIFGDDSVFQSYVNRFPEGVLRDSYEHHLKESFLALD